MPQKSPETQRKGGKKTRPAMKRRCTKTDCDRPAYSNSDLCRICLMERNAQNAKRKQPNNVSNKAAKTVAVDNLNSDGPTIASVDELSERLRSEFPNEYWRFAADFSALRQSAIFIDNGHAGSIGQFRQLSERINMRIDRMFGEANLDMTARLQKLIDDNVAKRVANGWG